MFQAAPYSEKTMKRDTKEDARSFNALLKRIAAKERGALEEFYNLYGKFIFISVKTVTGTLHIVDEIVDDVLVKLWNGAGGMSAVANPLGWLYTVAVNCAKDRLRTAAMYEDIYDIAVEDSGIADVENGDSFHSLLAPLDEDERAIIILHIAEGLPFKDIAAELLRPLSSVTSAYYRALEKIKNKMG